MIDDFLLSLDKSDVFRVTNCPVPSGLKNHHEGVDALLGIMENQGLKFYRTNSETEVGGRNGLIGSSDVVMVKVNAQWKYRGCTNSDVVRGLIQRVLEHPDGFDGEVVLFDNGQGGGSLECDTMWGRQYPDTGVHANAEDENHTFSYLVDKVFAGSPVSKYLLDPIRETFISEDDHSNDGYRRMGEISYPCFMTTNGNRVELREGVWNGEAFNDRIKLINVPVLKHHGGCGITGALKSYYGILSMADGNHAIRHYDRLGAHCGKMVSEIRAPILNILDCIWVTQTMWAGYPAAYTTKLNQLLASIDPVALDYWASKYLLYPIDGNPEHHPEKFDALRNYLVQARDTINLRGGVAGQKVTMDELNINIYNLKLS